MALFAYMRPDHLRRTVTSLQANPLAAETDLYVFCDAPKRADHERAVRRHDPILNAIAVRVLRCPFAPIQIREHLRRGHVRRVW